MSQKIDGDILERIAREAGQIVMQTYLPGMQVDTKADHSPVTIADKAAHDHIISKLREHFPSIPVISEESVQEVDYQTRRYWPLFFLVDPLDGTKEFIRMRDEFTVNIALIENETPILAVIHHPVENCSFVAKKGQGVWKIQSDHRGILMKRNPGSLKPIQPILSRSHKGDEQKWLQSHYSADRLLAPIEMGSSWKFCMVADQKADLYLRLKPTSEWDIAAGQLIVEESGMRMCRLDTMTAMTYNKESLINPGFVVMHP